MKSFLLILTFVFAFSANALILNNYSNVRDIKGTVTYNDKVFIKVYSAAGVAKGSVVFLDTSADDGMTVTTATNAALKPLCMVAETISALGIGKCQIYGYTDALLFEPTTTAVVNEPVYHSSSIAGYSSAISSGSVAAYNVPIGTFLDASAATASIEAFLDF